MKKEWIFSLVGYVCLLVVSWIIGLWIYTANGNKSYEEVHRQYNSYFPAGLGSSRWLAVICIALTLTGIFSLKESYNHIKSKAWKSFNTAVIVVLAVLLLFNLWGLM